MKYSLQVLICWSCILTLSCSSTKHSAISSITPTENKLLFLILHLQRDSIQNTIKATLLNKIIAGGTIKQNASAENISSEDPIILYFIDHRHKVIQKLYFQNPLYKHIEYTDESGIFQNKDINLQETDFTARLAIPKGAEYIEVYHHEKKELHLIYQSNL